MARKYINEHRVVHDYDLCTMVKTAQDGDLTLPMLETEYSGLFGQYYACWCPGSLSRQGISRHGIGRIGYVTCKVAPLFIWSSFVEQSRRYDSKCEDMFRNL